MAVPKKHFKIYASKWHLLSALLFIAAPFLFLLWFSHFIKLTLSTLFFDTFVSVERMAIAYGIAVLVAWILAVLFYQGKRSAITLPIFDVLQSFPTFAALPIVALRWGASGITVILFLVFAILWPIFFSLISSLRLLKHDWQEVVQITKLSGFDYVRYFLFPVSIPGLITGSIVGLGDAWEVLIATEIIVRVKTGLGSFFELFSANPMVTVLGIFGFLLLIFSINKLIWLPLLDWSHKKWEE